MRKSVLAVAAAVSMIGASSGALAQSAAALSIASADVRAGAPAGADVTDESDLRGGFILPTLGVLAIIAIIYLVTKNDNPGSP